jgi:hypothetical protein
MIAMSGLKIQYSQECVGSTPTSGTLKQKRTYGDFRRSFFVGKTGECYNECYIFVSGPSGFGSSAAPSAPSRWTFLALAAARKAGFVLM